MNFFHLITTQEWEDQLSQEREKSESFKRQLNNLKLRSDSSIQRQRSGDSTGSDPTTNSINTPYRSQAASQHTSSQSVAASPYHYSGSGFDTNNHHIELKSSKKNMSSGSSVVSMGSEFAQRAKSLVHLINCQGGERDTEFSPLAEDAKQRLGSRR
jgi:hypothetical protein